MNIALTVQDGPWRQSPSACACFSLSALAWLAQHPPDGGLAPGAIMAMMSASKFFAACLVDLRPEIKARLERH